MAYSANQEPTGLTAKVTPVDADVVIIGDSADAVEVAKKTTWANIKATLKTYNDTLYAAVLGADDNYATDAEKTKLSNLSGTNTGDQTVTNSSDATSHTVTLSASGGSVQLIEGTNITLTTGGTGSAGTVTITASGGSGDVTKVGTPVNNQVGVWTGDGTLEGDAAFTFDTATDALSIGTSGVFTTGTIELGAASDTTIARSGAGAITVEGVQVVLANTSPTLATITTTGNIELGHASDTTLSRSAAGVLAVEGVVIPSISSTNTLTNKRVTPRAGTTTSSATPTINTDNYDYYSLTAQTVDITSFTTNLSGTPTDGQKLWISITGTAARAITWGASFEASTIALPTTTVSTNRLDVGFVWHGDGVNKWRCVASA